MTRKNEDSAEGKEAQRISSGLFKGGHWLPGADNQRGANEGLGAREIKALESENGTAWGLSRAAAVIAERCRQAGH